METPFSQTPVGIVYYAFIGARDELDFWPGEFRVSSTSLALLTDKLLAAGVKFPVAGDSDTL